MTRIERLTDRAISFAIAEANEDLAVARLAFLVRVRYEDQPTPDQPTTASTGRPNGGKCRAPGSSRGPRRDDQPG
jgi:hypothetical protein